MTTNNSLNTGAVPLPPVHGGSGVANTGTFTVGGNTSFVGAFTFAGTVTGNTAVTFPTAGTLSTLLAAVKADQETATSNTVAVTPGVQQFHPSSVKAWALSNATLSAVTASYNVASITDGGTGVVSFNYTVAFSGAAVSAVNWTNQTNDSAAYSIQAAAVVAASSSAYLRNSTTSALVDPGAGLMFAAYGDQ